MNLYVMRHGRTNYNELGLCNDDPTADVHLNDIGQQQAQAAAEQLRDVALDRIIVSPLPRTRQTAEFVNQYHHAPIEVHPAINGQGQTTFNLLIAVITAVVGFPLGFILISNYGVLGLIVTTLSASIPGTIVALVFIKQRYNVTVHWKSSAKILLSSAVAAAVTYMLLTQLTAFSSLIRLIIGVAVFTPTYIIAAIVTKTFGTTDINNLREMLTALGPLRPIFNIILNLIEKLMTTLTPNKKQDKQQPTEKAPFQQARS